MNASSVNFDTLDDQLKELISYAIIKTKEIISKHEWLNNDSVPTNVRIGHFVTNLRRDLTVFISILPDDIIDNSTTYTNVTLKDFLKKLYDADMWRDVGEPSRTLYRGRGSGIWRFSCVYNNKIWKMDESKIMDICAKATELPPVQEISKIIEDSLVNLQREMYPLIMNIDKINRINTESKQIIENLCAIAEGNING